LTPARAARDRRGAILAFIERYPGVHVREVERQLGLSNRLASYHLEALHAGGAVALLRERGHVRVVARNQAMLLPAAEVRFICMMRRGPALRIVLLLLEHRELRQGAIAEMLDLAKPSASYHLAGLLDAGVARARRDGRERFYRLADPTWVRAKLATFEPLPGERDAFTALWDDFLR